jgi:outer membrane protein OmpA-like peptidoglycan-associated protein
VSEDNKFPGPPPDDFSKTTPNVNIGGNDDSQRNDWDKTNYNFPKQPTGDDWGKTVTNIRPIDTSGEDFGKTILPGSQPAPQTPDWGLTAANVRVNPADIGSTPEEFGGGVGYDKTTPYFRLPEAERAKYQNLPPTPTEKAEQEKKEREAAGGIPGWMWAGAGMFAMFTFAILILGLVYFLVIRDTYFNVTVRQAPPGSRITVDDKNWGVTREDGTHELTNLNPGKRIIKIIHANYECKEHEVNGEAGVTPEPVVARCTAIKLPPQDCETFNPGEFDKAERCYNMALDNLPDAFTAEDLINALNILIINFEVNKYDIPPDRLAALQKGAGFIKKLQQRDPTIVLEVGGHTDSDGSPATNNPLSQNRATAVKNQLVRYGVNDAGLQTRGYGADKPKFDNNTDKNKFLNRRIQYSIVGPRK